MTFYPNEKMVGRKVSLNEGQWTDAGYYSKGHILTIKKVAGPKDYGIFTLEDANGELIMPLGRFTLLEEEPCPPAVSKPPRPSREIRYTVSVNGKDIKTVKELDEVLAGSEAIIFDVDKTLEDAFAPVNSIFSRFHDSFRLPFLRLRKVVEKIEESEKEKEGK